MTHLNFLNHDIQLRGTCRHNRCLHSDFTTRLQMAPSEAEYTEEDFKYSPSLGRHAAEWDVAGLEDDHSAPYFWGERKASR